jgi:parallel beta-helix repeat protein
MNNTLKIFALLLISASTAHAKSLYVSGTGSDVTGLGTYELPYRSIQKASDLTNPGDTVWLRNGTYAPVTITRSGDASAQIVYKAVPGHTPEITTSGTGAWRAVWLKASYLVFDGLVLTGNAGNVTLEQARADGKAKTPSSIANVNDSGFDSLDSRYNGSGLSPSEVIHHITIVNSTVRRFGCAGISLWGDYLTAKNNKVYENSWYSRYGCSGMSAFTTRNFDNNPGYRNKFIGNMMWNNKSLVIYNFDGTLTDGNGFIFDVDETNIGVAGQTGFKEKGGYTGRTLIANNLAVNNGGSGIHVFDSRNTDVVNNTVYKNATVMNTAETTRLGVPVKDYPDLFAAYSSDTHFYNNIVYASPGHKVNSSSKNVNVTYDYNLYFDGGLSPNIAVGTRSANDIVADPQFVNPSITPCIENPDRLTLACNADFRLKPTSPAVNRGRSLPKWVDFYINKDITGTARGTTNIDLGAYESVK